MPKSKGPSHLISSIAALADRRRDGGKRLKKELTLFDVYAISTGAMFSSGFFLLPGLAAAQAGPAVVLAYLIAGILILPAMLSQAELCTAMPRAGGAYYFLDRSMGPMIGTIGGLGTFFALTLKSAFALVGMGAYLALFIELPIKPLAVALTVAFMGLNIFGAKETTTLQRILVVILISVLAYFVTQGIFEIVGIGFSTISRTQFTPFMPFGIAGVLSTVGFVFVSYAGLTKVASVAEEVEDPDRTIPLGMMLSLASATLIYVVGVFIMVSVLDADELRTDLTPVATAGAEFFDWLPGPTGLILIVVAAVAAFASTGNAGLMSASRYPYAMARDRLVPDRFAHLGRFRTPHVSIMLTAVLMIASIVLLSEEGIAKLASAFQLLIFALLNGAVIVMRESRLNSYDPGFRSPLYPWLHIFGVITSFALIGLMGWLPMLFTLGMIVFSLVWYFRYAKKRVTRDGAIYHWFELLGRKRYHGVDRELRTILKEKGLRKEDPFEAVVARAGVFDVQTSSFEEITAIAAKDFAKRIAISEADIREEFLESPRIGATPVAHGIALSHFQSSEVDQPELVLARSLQGVPIEVDASKVSDADIHGASEIMAYGVFYLISPAHDPGQHLRMLAKVASRVDRPGFLPLWMQVRSVERLRDLLLMDQHTVSLRVGADQPTRDLVGRTVADIDWPSGSLVAFVERGDDSVVPRGGTELMEGDVIFIIGYVDAIEKLRNRYESAAVEDG